VAPDPEPRLSPELASLWAISVEIALLHKVPDVLDRILHHCLELTSSEFGFVGLTDADGQMMDVAAIRGFDPTDATFYKRFHLIPVRPNIFGAALRERRTSISNDVLNDPERVGQPRGHPPVRTFLGVPLQVGDQVIGMVGVANRNGGYTEDHGRLLSTFANQGAVAIENARLVESQQEMIAKLGTLNRELAEAEREQGVLQERQRIADAVRVEVEGAIVTIGQRINAVLESPNLSAADADHLIQARQIAARTAQVGITTELKPRHIQILRLIGQGHSNREIADQLHLSENTVKTHIQGIFNVLAVRNRAEAAMTAAKRNLI
jgi:GAF domain-containing protein